MGQQTSTVTRLEDYDPGHARIAGTDGGTPIETAVTYGQDDHGTDLQAYGDTSSNYMLWDESVDSLLLVGTVAKFSLGSFTGAAIGTGSVVSATTTAPFKVFADDGGAAIGSGSLVRAGWFRNLQTYTGGNREQEATGVQGSLVSVAGTNRHNMSGVLGSYEARTSLTVGGQSAATDTWIQAGVLGRVGMSTGTLVVDTNAVLAGVAAMSNVNSAVSETLTGVYAAFYAGAWASAIDWAYGMVLEGGKFTTGIAIGTCTDGITIAACTGHLISAATTSTWGTGITGGAIAIGDYSNAVAFGTVSEHIIGQVINISAAVDDDSNIIPLHVAFANTADCGSNSVGQVIYARSTLAYAITDCYSVRARLDITDATTPSVNQLFGIYSTVTTKACTLATTGMIAGLATEITGTQDVTQAGSYAKVCGLYVAWKEENAMTVDTVGVYVANFTGAALDAGFRVNSVGDTVSAFRSEQGGGTVTNGLELVAAHTNAFALPASGTAPVSTGGTVGTHGTATLKIAMTIGGSTYYLLASTVPTFT